MDQSIYLTENAPQIRMMFFFSGLVLFLIIELVAPYRRPTISKLNRWIDNISLAMFNTIVLKLLFASILIQTADFATTNNQGVLNTSFLSHMPYWLKTLIVVVFLDFMLYVWHLLNHIMPFLFRFHRVHHSDLNMDVSTATRFHIGELSISMVIKTGLVFFIGAEPGAVIIYETLVVLCAQFHHSSLKVPVLFEKIFGFFFVPPSMHRIHHSVKFNEMDSNYGVIFSLWDRGLGTLKKDIDQDNIAIGMGAYRNYSKIRLKGILIMPFIGTAGR